MRDPKRIPKILRELKKVWLKYPDLRLGQLIVDVCMPFDPFHVEDDKLLEYLKYPQILE